MPHSWDSRDWMRPKAKRPTSTSPRARRARRPERLQPKKRSCCTGLACQAVLGSGACGVVAGRELRAGGSHGSRSISASSTPKCSVNARSETTEGLVRPCSHASTCSRLTPATSASCRAGSHHGPHVTAASSSSSLLLRALVSIRGGPRARARSARCRSAPSAMASDRERPAHCTVLLQALATFPPDPERIVRVVSAPRGAGGNGTFAASSGVSSVLRTRGSSSGHQETGMAHDSARGSDEHGEGLRTETHLRHQ